MTRHNDADPQILAADPRSGNSLVPMLVNGLVLIVLGMIGVWILV